MKLSKTPHIWSKESLLNKSQRYAEKMIEQDRNSWMFGFWSALTLELLIKAAISNISPTLIAEKDWRHVYFGLGYSHPDGQPKTASISELLNRSVLIIPGFNKDMHNFCSKHLERRNSDIHSGDLPFDELKSSEWLAEFYLTSECLLKTLKKPLSSLFGDEDSKTAKILIKAYKNNAAKSVQKKIDQYKVKWFKQTKSVRENLSKQASLLATRNLGHRVICPSCKADALVKGSASGLPSITTKDDVVEIKSPMLPTNFECFACKLKISGYAKLNAAKLGSIYTSTQTFDAADYYGSEPVDEWDGYEEDNNEP